MSIIKGLFNETMPGLEKALDLTWRRNEAISSNVANAETPGYRAVQLNFGEELERAFDASPEELTKTDARHIDVSTSSGAHLMPDYSGVTKPDGNNVDLDIQMGQLAFNKGRYTMAANLVRKKLSMLSTIVRQTA